MTENTATNGIPAENSTDSASTAAAETTTGSITTVPAMLEMPRPDIPARKPRPAIDHQKRIEEMRARMQEHSNAEDARPRPIPSKPKPREHKAVIPTAESLRRLTKQRLEAAAAAKPKPEVTATPKRRALIVGVGEVGAADAKAMFDVCRVLRYHEVRLLTSTSAGNIEPQALHGAPTRAEILAGFGWLVAGVVAGDVLLFHYSGPAGRFEAAAETIVPSDHVAAGRISSAEIQQRLVVPLRDKGAALRIVFDGQQTGAGLDLKHNLADTSRLRDTHATARAAVAAAGTLCEGHGTVANERIAAVLRRRHFVVDGPSRLIEWDTQGRGRERPFAAGIGPRPPASAPQFAEVLVLSSHIESQPRTADSTLTRCFLEVVRRRLCRGTGDVVWPSVVDVARDVRVRVHTAGAELTPQCSSEAPIDEATAFNLA